MTTRGAGGAGGTSWSISTGMGAAGDGRFAGVETGNLLCRTKRTGVLSTGPFAATTPASPKPKITVNATTARRAIGHAVLEVVASVGISIDQTLHRALDAPERKLKLRRRSHRSVSIGAFIPRAEPSQSRRICAPHYRTKNGDGASMVRIIFPLAQDDAGTQPRFGFSRAATSRRIRQVRSLRRTKDRHQIRR